MSEHTPAERGRDELRERATKLAQGYLNYPQSVMLRDAIVALFDDLLAQREAPTAGDIDSLDAAMEALHDQLYAEGREGDALIVERAAYAIEALEVDRVLRAAPQGVPICLQCIERAEQEIAAGHYYRADELMAALRERREPVCACGETHPDRTPLAAARPAPETREPELLGYVVERQLTTGEWMRVWRGRPLWFDHDEAVLERDAYALDGIPAHIRPVYLGAPAPAEATEPPCYCTPGVYTPSADCPRHMRPAEATERSGS